MSRVHLKRRGRMRARFHTSRVKLVGGLSSHLLGSLHSHFRPIRLRGFFLDPLSISANANFRWHVIGDRRCSTSRFAPRDLTGRSGCRSRSVCCCETPESSSDNDWAIRIRLASSFTFMISPILIQGKPQHVAQGQESGDFLHCRMKCGAMPLTRIHLNLEKA